MKRNLFLIVLISLICISSLSYAATVTVSASNLPSPTQIETFSFTLSVGGDFAFTASSGNANGTLIPTPPSSNVLPWAYDNNATPSVGSYVATFFNGDAFDIVPPPGDGSYTLNNMLSGTGTVGVFDFTGTINGISSFAITDNFGNPVTYSNLIVPNWNASTNTANFNVVPIPGTLLLLGSGIIGLVGLNRRRKT